MPVTQASAASGISLFVGYADSERAGGEFPNPWLGSPNVTFDGCIQPCIFDAGTLRVENDNTTSVTIGQVTVHLGACAYTWSGSLYPVTLPPGGSLITTQRGPGAAEGCTGPDPASFDGSDIPSGTCTNDGIVPTVDVTVDGVTTSASDSGQVLNSGGIDPAMCTGDNESTQWVRIGSKACPGQSLSLAPAAQTEPIGSHATVSATFTNACGSPLPGVLVKFAVTAGPNAGLTGSGVTDPLGSASFTYPSLVVGTDSLQATITNSVGFRTTSNTAGVTWTVEFAPGGASFVIGDRNAVIGNSVNFWGAQWAKRNSLTGGAAPRSFKGFAEAPEAPSCGDTWTADPGNSTPPPDGPLPEFMAVIVASSAHQSGPSISGNVAEIVVVRTFSGYRPDPGHQGMGTVVSVICSQASTGTTASSPARGQTSGGSGITGATTASAACQSEPPGQSRNTGADHAKKKQPACSSSPSNGRRNPG